MSSQNAYTVLRESTLKHILSRIQRAKHNAYLRTGSFATEVIWEGRRFVFPKEKKSTRANMWMFKAVIDDVRLHIMSHKIREKKKLPVNYWNPKNKNFRGKITATDLDHAYWRVAFLYEYISMKTYLRGLEVKDKSIRLAALANLSSHKDFLVIKAGQVTKESVTMKYDPILHKVYSNIRYTCYGHMMKCAEMLGDDFICYKTDCLYYKDTPENRKIVQDYLDSEAIEWKQLVEPDRPKKENDEHYEIK
jgi:hypothetical protein